LLPKIELAKAKLKSIVTLRSTVSSVK
jgi:hypothetical protein